MPSFFYHMHIPKTGGRTFTYLTREVTDVLQGNACSWDLCCTPWEKYIEAISTTTTLNGDPDHPCRSFSREIALPGIVETRRLVRSIRSENRTDHADPDDWWYLASLYHNPISRFVSAAKHNLRAGRCDTQNVRRAVLAKLRGGCQPVGHDREQAQYFYQTAGPFDLNATDGPFLPAEDATVEDPWAHVSAFDFVGITNYMDASTCVVAMDLASLHYATAEKAYQACGATFPLRIQSTAENETDMDPLTTSQILRILTDRHPVDAQMYPLVLDAFAHKLSQVLVDRPELERMYQVDLEAIRMEQTVWSRVAAWLRDYKDDDATLFKLLDGMYHKHVLATGLGWGQPRIQK